jgi:CheY-like chemotaxis protein
MRNAESKSGSNRMDAPHRQVSRRPLQLWNFWQAPAFRAIGMELQMAGRHSGENGEALARGEALRDHEDSVAPTKDSFLTGVQKRVLIVEDEALVAMMIEDMVMELGHTVAGVASRLKDGLQMAEAGDVDFAILDVSLNGERSLPIAEKLDAKGIPYVFATGYGARGIDGARPHAPTLSKPFGIEDLRRILPKA